MVNIVHRADTISQQNFNKDRLKYEKTIDYSLISFKDRYTGDDQIYDTRYPLDSVITSQPILMNFDSFNTQNPNNFVNMFQSPDDPRTNYQIEFRSADNYDMSSSSNWESINVNSYRSTTNYEMFDLINRYNTPTSTDDSVLEITSITSGLSINAISYNSIGEAGFISLKDGVSGLSTFSSLRGTYMVGEFTASQAGPVADWVVLHSKEIDSGRDDIKNVRAPYKNLLYIDKPFKEQLVTWDLTDWDDESNRIDNMRTIGWKVLEGTTGKISLDIKNLRLYTLSQTGVGGVTSGVPFPLSQAGKYVQYRLTMSRTDVFDNMFLSGIQFTTNVRKTVLPSSLMRHNKFVNLGAVNYPDRSGLRIIY